MFILPGIYILFIQSEALFSVIYAILSLKLDRSSEKIYN